MDKSTGGMTIHKFSEAYEGKYMCKATNRLEVSPGHFQVAVSLSAIITLDIRKHKNFPSPDEVKQYTRSEFEYLKIPCGPKPAHTENVFFKWAKYSSKGRPDQFTWRSNRYFEDIEGHLHFVYLTLDDSLTATGGRYECQTKFDEGDTLRSGPSNFVNVTKGEYI